MLPEYTRKTKRIFIDITQTYHNYINTGIQRVAKNVAERMQNIAVETDIESWPVVNYLDSFYIINLQEYKKRFTYKLTIFLKTLYNKFKTFVRRYPSFHFLLKIIFPCFIRARLISSYNKFINMLNFWCSSSAQLRFSESDVLLLVEAGWVSPCWKAIKKAKRKGAKIVQIIHDLIPIKYPELVNSESTYLFDIWLSKTIKYVDSYVCNSRYTCEELKMYMGCTMGINISKYRFDYFDLGCDVKNMDEAGFVRPKLENIIAKPTNSAGYLCVGTIEPRKNQMYLLDAFERVWDQNRMVRLFIVGREGWKGRDIINRIKKHPMLNKSLFMFNDLSDTELDFLYRRCKALIFPTIAEGFGLPIVEALSKRLPVLASDIEVLREVGKDFCAYFNLEQSESLATMILDIETRNKWPIVRNINEFKATTWRESCEQLVGKILQIFQEQHVGK
ncbi:MAG: hypothetical protein DRP74_08365 [Candidatus Omnitrophota bacterium]|nr:MAG: hypothetical protein DRP74_08365 [Candidatus Omnitrophota bacterium]